MNNTLSDLILSKESDGTYSLYSDVVKLIEEHGYVILTKYTYQKLIDDSVMMVGLAKKLKQVEEQRDSFIKRSDVITCSYCANYIGCAPDCSEYIEGVGDADGKFPKWKWNCKCFDYGTCGKLEHTPCNGCIANNYSGFVWDDRKNR